MKTPSLFIIFLLYSVRGISQVPVVDAIVKDVSCFAYNDGQISYSFTGGEGPFLYQWLDGDSGLAIGDCTYRIKIDNPGNTLVDFQIRVDVAHTASMNSDYSDIYFTDSTGSVLYDFWLQDFPSPDSAVFWVKVNYIPSGHSEIFLSFCSSTSLNLGDPYATFDYFDNYDNGSFSGWSSSCEAVNHSCNCEYCDRGITDMQYFSPDSSVSLFGHASCLSPPYDGVRSLLSKTINLVDGDYIVDYEDRISVELYSFCGGNTSGYNRVQADATSLGNGSTASVGGSCSTVINGWNHQTTNTFSVTGGSVDIDLVTRAGDCSNVEGWFDNFRIRKYAPVTITVDTTEALVKDSLPAGTYIIQFSDANGVTYTDTFVVNGPQNIVIVDSVKNISCYGKSDGEIDVYSAGGNGQHQYVWLHGPNSSSIGNLSAGTYSVTVFDANNGCSATFSDSITEPLPITLDTQLRNVNCYGGDDGFIAIQPSGGTGMYSYRWPDGDSLQQRNDLTAGTYKVTVADANQCRDSISVVINEPDSSLSIYESSHPDTICSGANNGYVDITVTGGTPQYTYLWSDGSADSSLENVSSGNYGVTVTDVNGCIVSESFSISERLLDLNISVSPDTIITAGSPVELVVNYSPPNYTFDWAPVNTNSQGNIYYDTPNESTTYSVTVTSKEGCTTSDTVMILIENINIVIVPSAFTPNGDGINDILRVLTTGSVNLEEFSIFNRWGEKIFSTGNIESGWNGFYNDEPQPIGTYVYQLKYLDPLKGTVLESGAVSLLR